jgi:hypothetical protein
MNKSSSKQDATGGTCRYCLGQDHGVAVVINTRRASTATSRRESCIDGAFRW